MKSYLYQDEVGKYFQYSDCVILNWPRQSGKTFYSTYLINEFLLKNGFKKGAIFSLGIFLSIFDSKFFDSMGEDVNDQILHKSENGVEYKNRSKLLWHSIRSTAMIGTAFDFIVFDEYLSYDTNNALNKIIPNLSIGAKIIFTGTPGNMSIQQKVVKFLNTNKIKYFIHKL